jgi:hypothetical protein
MNELQTGRAASGFNTMDEDQDEDERSKSFDGKGTNAHDPHLNDVVKPAFTVCKKSRIPRAFGNRINCVAIPPT